MFRKDPVKELEEETKKIKKEIERLLTERARIRDLGIKVAAGLPIPGAVSPTQAQDRLDTLRRLTVQKNYLAYQARLKQLEAEIDQEIQKLEKDVAEMEQKLQEPLSLVITYPTRGVSVSEGSTLSIQWISTGPVGDRLRIVLVKAGAPFRNISFGAPNLGTFDWKIPKLPTANDYQIYISDPASGLQALSEEFEIK